MKNIKWWVPAWKFAMGIIFTSIQLVQAQTAVKPIVDCTATKPVKGTSFVLHVTYAEGAYYLQEQIGGGFYPKMSAIKSELDKTIVFQTLQQNWRTNLVLTSPHLNNQHEPVEGSYTTGGTFQYKFACKCIWH